jgi:hypothetical protein
MNCVLNVFLSLVVTFAWLNITCIEAVGGADAQPEAPAVRQVAQNMPVVPSKVHVTPPETSMRLTDEQGDGVQALVGDDVVDDEASLTKQITDVEAAIRLLKQKAQLETLKRSLEELNNTSSSKVKGALVKRVVKLVNGVLGQVETILGIGVPVISVLILVNFYRAIKQFFGIDAGGYSGGYSGALKCDKETGICTPISPNQAATGHGVCTSVFPFSLFDPNC